MEWVSVKDRLPEFDIEVFIYYFDVDKFVYGVASLGKGGYWDDGIYTGGKIEPTHWMLPEPPTA